MRVAAHVLHKLGRDLGGQERGPRGVPERLEKVASEHAVAAPHAVSHRLDPAAGEALSRRRAQSVGHMRRRLRGLDLGLPQQSAGVARVAHEQHVPCADLLDAQEVADDDVLEVRPPPARPGVGWNPVPGLAFERAVAGIVDEEAVLVCEHVAELAQFLPDAHKRGVTVVEFGDVEPVVVPEELGHGLRVVDRALKLPVGVAVIVDADDERVVFAHLREVVLPHPLAVGRDARGPALGLGAGAHRGRGRREPDEPAHPDPHGPSPPRLDIIAVHCPRPRRPLYRDGEGGQGYEALSRVGQISQSAMRPKA